MRPLETEIQVKCRPLNCISRLVFATKMCSASLVAVHIIYIPNVYSIHSTSVLASVL